MGEIEQQQRHKSSPAPVNFEFEDSRLGTREYWDQFYDAELANFEDTGDEGEIWFGRAVELRLLKFILERVPLSARICDLGSGNGSLLRKLHDRGYSALSGVDYSQKAIELAIRSSSPTHREAIAIAANPGHPGTARAVTTAPIHFKIVDLTAKCLDESLKGRFDILLDKGTLDAISLAPNRAQLLANYQQNICQMFGRSASELDDDLELLGTKEVSAAALMLRRQQKRLLVIVSCNFTKDELVDLLETDEGLYFYGELPAYAGTAGSSIQFGGKVGRTTTSAIFRWRGGRGRTERLAVDGGSHPSTPNNSYTHSTPLPPLFHPLSVHV